MWWVVVLGCVGCGRIGFAVGGGDGGDDGNGGPTADARATVLPATPLSDPTAMADCPTLVWDGTQWAVAWRDLRDGATGEIYFARADATGVKLGADLRVTNDAGNTECPALVSNGNGAFLVVFADDRFGNFEIIGQFIGATGTLIGGPIRITTDNSASTEPALGWYGAGYDLAWSDVRGVNQEVHYAGLDTNAVATAAPVVLSGTGQFVDYPIIAEAPSGGTIGWYDASAGNLVRFAHVSGGVVTANTSSLPSGIGAWTALALASTGSELAAIWVDEPVSQMYVTKFAKIDPATAATSAVATLDLPLGITERISLVAGAGAFGFAYDSGVIFTLRGLDGQPADAPVRLGGHLPSLAFDGTAFGCAIVTTNTNVLQLARIAPS